MKPKITAGPFLALLTVPLLVALFGWAVTAMAQDRAAWFKSLMQPDTGLSCCDISDCMKTRAEFRSGGWIADVRGVWTPIPPRAVLRDPPSIDGEAYVCSSPARKIYCFIPPSPGS